MNSEFHIVPKIEPVVTFLTGTVASSKILEVLGDMDLAPICRFETATRLLNRSTHKPTKSEV